jgi:cell wall-associated NlpC family hydrolase
VAGKEFSAGTVYVQVLPSLDGWDAAMKRALKGLGGDKPQEVKVVPELDARDFDKQLKALGRDIAKVKVTIEADRAKAKEEAKKAAGAFADEANRVIAATLADLPDIEVGADASEADQVIARVRAELAGLQATIKPDMDSAAFLAHVERLRAVLATVDGAEVSVDAKFNAAKALAEMEAFGAAVRQAGDRHGGAFAESFTNATKGVLNSLRDIKIDADSTPAERKLAKIREAFTKLSALRIGVDISAEKALAKADALAKKLSALDGVKLTIQERFDLAHAFAQFDRFRAEVQTTGRFAERTIAGIRREMTTLAGQRIGIDIEDADAKAKVADLRRRLTELAAATISLKVKADVERALADLALVEVAMAAVDGQEAEVTVSDGGSSDHTITRMKALILACVAGAGAIGGLAAALLTLGSAAVVGAAGLGAVAVGAKDIVAAMKAQTAASTQAGQTAAQEAAQRLNAANQLATAQDGLRAATTAVGEAQRSASTSVRQALAAQAGAERQLRDAQLAALRAQQNLTEARRDAVRSLEDMQNKALDDALEQRAAVLELAQAQENLKQTLADPTANEAQRAQAQLTLDQARQHLVESRVNAQRSAQDAAQAAQAGVEGAKQVVAAQDNLLAAQQRTRDAQEASAESARRVEDARVQGASAVARAQQQVVASQRQLVSAGAAVATQATAQGAAHEKFSQALDKLSPASVRLVEYLRSQGGAWREVSLASQGFAPGLQAALQTLQPHFSQMATNVGTLSQSFGSFLNVVAGGLGRAGPFFDTIANASVTLFPRFGETVNRAGSALATLVTDLLPLAPTALDTVDAFSGLIKVWSPFIAQASGPLLRGLQDVIKNLDFLGPLLVTLARPVADLTNALVSGLRAAFINMNTPLAQFLRSLVNLVATVSPMLGSIGRLAGVAMDVLVPAIEAVNVVLKPLVFLVEALAKVLDLIPAPLLTIGIGLVGLKLAAGPLARVFTDMSLALGSANTQVAQWSTKVGLSAGAASKLEAAGAKAAGAVSALGRSLPAVGGSLLGVGIAIDQINRKVAEMAEGLNKGGQAGVDAAKDMAFFRAGQNVAAHDMTMWGGLTQFVYKYVADSAEESAKKETDALNSVQQAQQKVAKAQQDYDLAVRTHAANSPEVKAASNTLVWAKQDEKKATDAAAEAAKTYTERLQDQQDQELAMRDTRVAHERAGLRVQQAQRRITAAQQGVSAAPGEVAAAQQELSAARQSKDTDRIAQAEERLAGAQEHVLDSSDALKEAQWDLLSAQSTYVSTANAAAVAQNKVTKATDNSRAGLRGSMQAAAELAGVYGQTLPASTQQMLVSLDEADRKFLGINTRLDTTKGLLLTLPGTNGNPPLTIEITDNLAVVLERFHLFAIQVRDQVTDVVQNAVGDLFTGLFGQKPTGPKLGPPAPAQPNKFQNLLTPKPKASGGLIPGSGNRDTVPAWLTPGEFVIRQPAVRALGVPALTALNAQHFATGGPVGYASGGEVAAGGSAGGTGLLDYLASIATQFSAVTTAADPMAAALTDELVPAFTGLTDASAALALGTRADWLAITAAIGAATTTITTTHLAALRQALALVDTALTNTASTFQTRWAAIRGYAADPVRYAILGPFNAGLVAAWNLIDTTFGVGKPLAPLPIGFAEGGPVDGGQIGTDSVPALLTPGEFVIPRPMVRQIGMSNLEAARQSVLSGGSAEGVVPGFEAGGAVTKALAFAASQVGKPYLWGGVGPDGFDCSGLISAVANVALGLSPYQRRFTTDSFAPNQGAGGFVPGRGSAFVIGVSDAHMAGTLAGHNVESTTKNGVSGVRVDGDASGALDSQFRKGQFFLPEIGGMFIPGPEGGKPFSVDDLLDSTFGATRASIASILPSFPNNTLAAGATAALTRMLDAVAGYSRATFGTAGTPGSGPVVDQVRRVAARHGWAQGAAWDAWSTLISHESGWNPAAQNPTSTAYGLGQLLDGTWAGTGIAKTSNPAQQAEAMARYILGRYGDPVRAWKFWQGNHWYDQGGYLPPGLSLSYNGTGHPERVLTAQQEASLLHTKAGGQFTGELYLDSGAFLGQVRGEIQAANDSTGRAILQRTRL